MAVEIVNNDNYADFRSSEPAVLVFRLRGCVHCIRYAPVIESISEKFQDVRFGEVTVDDKQPISLIQKDFSQIFRAGGFPTTAVIRENQYPVYFAGGFPYEDSLEIIDGILNSSEPLPESFITRIHSIDPNASDIQGIDHEALMRQLIFSIQMQQVFGSGLEVYASSPKPPKFSDRIKSFLRDKFRFSH